MRRSGAWVVLLTALPAWADRTNPPPRPPVQQGPSCPLQPGWTFTGTYLCAQGETDLTLRVLAVRGGAVRAEFAFSHAPTAVVGRYTLAGRCADDVVTLAPEAWVQRPEGYVMVGMRGLVNPGATRYEGAITHASCGWFSVRR